MNLANRAPNMPEYHCHMLVHVVTVSIEKPIQTIPTTSWAHNLGGTGGGYTGFAQRIGKELFYDCFGRVLFLTVLPRRQSITYNQPPISIEIETIFTGLAGRTNTIS